MEPDPVYEKVARRGKKKGLNMKVYPYNRPKKIRLDFWTVRSFENKVLYAVYKCIRVFHVSIWFYFFPFVILLFNYGQVILFPNDELKEDFDCDAWNLKQAQAAAN